MKIKEALEWLIGCIVSEEYEKGKPNGNITCDLTREVLNMAIFALEKRVGEKPYPDDDNAILACPYCGSGEYLHNQDANRNRYCGQCGQKIDWEGEQ